ncbi:MAG: hypothetical protein ABR964_10950 [Tepidisphaeraceae bacterium]|jgi:hypothetical protein
MIRFCALIAAFVAALACAAVADAVDQPATAPATQPYVPHAAVVPPGFHALTAGERTVFCQAEDDDWVRQALARVQPATRPTTMPSDIAAAISQKRQELIRMVMQDMALDDPKTLNDTIDNELLPPLANLESLKLRVFYLPVSQKRLADLMQAGWSDPRFHYIRYAHQVVSDQNWTLSIDRPMDDAVEWIETQDDAPDARSGALVKGITHFESGLIHAQSLIAQSGTRNVIDGFIYKNVMQPLKLAPTEQWFYQGVEGVYSVKYATFLTGTSRSLLSSALLLPDPRNPLAWRPLDLVNPLDPAGMKPQFVIIYNEAVRHKAAWVISQWIDQGGDGALAKTLPALRAHPPANAAELIKIIRDSTGIDLTASMSPDYSLAPR